MSGTKWVEIIEEQRESGLSQAEFCRRKKISPSTFQYQRYQRQKPREGSRGGFVRVDGGEKIELEVGGVVLRVAERDLPSVVKALSR